MRVPRVVLVARCTKVRFVRPCGRGGELRSSRDACVRSHSVQIGIARRWRRASVVGGDHGRVDGRDEAAPLRQLRARRRRNSARSNGRNAARGSAAITDLLHARAAALSLMMPSATAHGSRRRARPRVLDGRPVAPGGRAAEGRGRSQSGAATGRRPHRTVPQSTGGRLARRGDGDLPGPRVRAEHDVVAKSYAPSSGITRPPRAYDVFRGFRRRACDAFCVRRRAYDVFRGYSGGGAHDVLRCFGGSHDVLR